MQSLTYQVLSLPDLDRTEYRARYGDDPASKLFEMQDNFLYTIYTVARKHPLRCSVIYSFNPRESHQDKKIGIFVRVIFDSFLDSAEIAQIKKIFEASFWKDFYQIVEVEDFNDVDLSWVQHISFGIRQEERLAPTVKRENSPSHYYLVHPFEPNDSVNRVGFLSKLEMYESQASVEIIFQPTMLEKTEQVSLENLLRVLRDQTSYDIVTSEISGKIREKPIDPVAERTLRQFDDLRESIQSHPLFETSIRVLAENDFSASLLLNEFWVESSQKPLYREIEVKKGTDLFDAAIAAFRRGDLFAEAVWSDYWNTLADASPLLTLKRLHRLFTVEDLSAFFRTVVPDSVVNFNGIPKETDLKSETSTQSILLGWQSGKSQNQALVQLKNLNKHVFICGVPGSGKTTAVLNLLFQLWTEHNIPFLVIEPAKTEYRAMLQCSYDASIVENDPNLTTQQYVKARDVARAISSLKADVKVYTLGNERVCPFRFNPFTFYGATTLDEHISTLEACFKAAMPLFGPLPALLSEAIEQIYAQQNWQPQDTAEMGIAAGRQFPTMQELYEAVTEILETKQYSSDVAGDIKTALEVRIGGLLRRSVGSMLNTRTSTPDIAELLSQPVILEMDSLNEEQANLMTMFILATLREYTKVTRKSGSSLKHVVVIEEAHNIVGTDASGNTEEGAGNPKLEATKYIVRMLAEMRALGQGIIVADQLPSAVSPEVIKNTNIKLAHRTVSGDDREILQQSMLLTAAQSEELARSNPGDAYIFMEGTYKPVRIKEPNTKLIYGIEEPPSNEELVECIKDQDFYKEVISSKAAFYQEKIVKYQEEALVQIEGLINNLILSSEAGKQLLGMDFIQQASLEKTQVGISSLDEFMQGSQEVIELCQSSMKRLWMRSRQHGVFEGLQSDEKIIVTVGRLKEAQQLSVTLYEQCQEKLKKLQDLRLNLSQGTLIQRNFEKIKLIFEKYCQAVDKVLEQLQRTESFETVEASYQIAKHYRDRFDLEAEEFEKLDMEGNLELAVRFSDSLEKMTNLISLREEKVSNIYKIAYSN